MRTSEVNNTVIVRFEIFTAVTMKKRRFLQEPQGVTSHKTPFFNTAIICKAELSENVNENQNTLGRFGTCWQQLLSPCE
jgi:hypothetical protein